MSLGYFSLAQKHNIYILQDSKLFFCYLLTSNCQIYEVLANGSSMTSYISAVDPCRAGKLVKSAVILTFYKFARTEIANSFLSIYVLISTSFNRQIMCGLMPFYIYFL